MAIKDRADKKGISVDELKHNRKENFKTGLANLAGGRGAWTQKNEFGSKPGASQTMGEASDPKESAAAEGKEKTFKAVKSAVEPSSGGGANTTSPSEDRTDMQSNAGKMTGRSGRDRSFMGMF